MEQAPNKTHWQQVERDALKQLEVARRELAKIALKEETDAENI